MMQFVKRRIYLPSVLPSVSRASVLGMKKAARRPKATPVSTLPTPQLLGIDLERCFQKHRHFVEQHFVPRDGMLEQDFLDMVMEGNLIAIGYLEQLYQSVPKRRQSRPSLVNNYFEQQLLAHVRRLNQMLCTLAAEGSWKACEELWTQALQLSNTFSDLSLKNPAPFRSQARHSLFMPSVRSRNPKFTADAAEIGRAIGLSEATVGDSLTDNRKRIGALCAQLVAECVNDIILARYHWEFSIERRKEAVQWPTPDEIRPYLGLRIHELFEYRDANPNPSCMQQRLLIFCLVTGCGVQRLHFLTLPPLTVRTAKCWWKQAVEQMVVDKFPTLLEDPKWLKELKAVSTGTPADMLKELKDYSREKVKQFVRTPQMA